MSDALLSLLEAEEVLGIPRWKLGRAIRDGELPGSEMVVQPHGMGRPKWMVPRTTLEDWWDRQQQSSSQNGQAAPPEPRAAPPGGITQQRIEALLTGAIDNLQEARRELRYMEGRRSKEQARRVREALEKALL